MITVVTVVIGTLNITLYIGGPFQNAFLRRSMHCLHYLIAANAHAVRDTRLDGHGAVQIYHTVSCTCKPAATPCGLSTVRLVRHIRMHVGRSLGNDCPPPPGSCMAIRCRRVFPMAACISPALLLTFTHAADIDRSRQARGLVGVSLWHDLYVAHAIGTGRRVDAVGGVAGKHEVGWRLGAPTGRDGLGAAGLPSQRRKLVIACACTSIQKHVQSCAWKRKCVRPNNQRQCYQL